MDFKALKAKSGPASLSFLSDKLDQMNDSGKRGDDRFWSPVVDKAGNGYNVIRFLPAPLEEDVPFIRIWDHGFIGPNGQWYIENSLTTIGQTDPVSEYNTRLWNSSTDDKGPERTQVRKQKRRQHFISNIYVIHDPAVPDNEGKVFLFKYGKKIFTKLTEAMEPEFQDEEPINPFDLWHGANFKLKIKHKDGFRNYDSSEFDKVSPLFSSDEKMEAIWKSEYSLQEFLAPSNFKSYEELKEKLYRVLAESVPHRSFDREVEASHRHTPRGQKPPLEEEDDDIERFRSLAS